MRDTIKNGLIIGMIFFIPFIIALTIAIIYTNRTCPLCEQVKAKANDIIINEKSEHLEYHCSKCGTDIEIDFGKEMQFYDKN